MKVLIKYKTHNNEIKLKNMYFKTENQILFYIDAYNNKNKRNWMSIVDFKILT